MAPAALGANRRRSRRVRWRLQVVFEHDPTRRAFTLNVSATGVCVASDYVALPGSEVRGWVVLPDSTKASFTALVRWAKKVRGAATLNGTNTMGLEFLTPISSEYLSFLGKTSPGLLKVSAPTAAAEPVPEFAEPPGSSKGSADRFSRVEWPLSPVDQVARLQTVVGPQDLAAASEGYPSGIAAEQAAKWFAEASRRCLAALLPRDKDSVVVGLSISLSHHPPVQVGARVTAMVKATRLTAHGRTVTFEATLSEGERQLAAGTMARLLVDRN